MSSWLKRADGGHINLNIAVSATAIEDSVNSWLIRIGSVTINAGPYASKALADDAIRRLVHGIDPTTLI